MLTKSVRHNTIKYVMKLLFNYVVFGVIKKFFFIKNGTVILVTEQLMSNKITLKKYVFFSLIVLIVICTTTAFIGLSNKIVNKAIN